MMELGKTLARLRRDNELMQQHVADFLYEKTGKRLTAKAISNWEVGLASPSIEQFLYLCDLYKVDDIRLTFRGIASTHMLNELGNRRINEYAQLLSADRRFSVSARSDSVRVLPRTVHQRIIKLYDLPASAGGGTFLGGDSYEELVLEDSAPACDYAVRIQGDSMMPVLADGQIAYVKETQTLSIGDIGIFALNGESYVKKLGRGKLISLNERYKPIPVRESDSFFILGCVVLQN